MSSKWRKAKLALGLNLCVYVPPQPTNSGDALLSPVASPANFTSPSALFSSSFFTRSPKVSTFTAQFCYISFYVCVCVCVIYVHTYTVFTN